MQGNSSDGQQQQVVYHQWIDITFSAVFFVLICLNLLQLVRSCSLWRKQAKTHSNSARVTKRQSSSLNAADAMKQTQ